LNEVTERERMQYISPILFAIIHRRLGDLDRFWMGMQAAFEERNGLVLFLLKSPQMHDTASDLIAQELARKIGLPL